MGKAAYAVPQVSSPAFSTVLRIGILDLLCSPSNPLQEDNKNPDGEKARHS
jgi:hypothetical protein